ncbi:hypothetical protein D3C76_1816260 [compost metagenome]
MSLTATNCSGLINTLPLASITPTVCTGLSMPKTLIDLLGDWASEKAKRSDVITPICL